jgi:Flp pilus assembly CpaE family ATPase
LLIEDNPADVELASMLLTAKANEFRLESRERLSSGLERLAQGGIDIVLLDLSLPDSQGIQTFERLHEAAPSLPVVIMSGLDDEQTAIHAVETGAQDYLVKGQLNATSLSRALVFAMQRQRKQSGRRHPGKILAFVGAKGGVGTTTVALNVGAQLARMGKSVIALELRSTFGTFAPSLSHAPQNHLGSLLQLPPEGVTEAEVAARLIEFPWGMKVLFGPQGVGEVQPIKAAHVEALLQKLVALADFVVVDLPDATSAASQAVARRAKFASLVVNNDPISVTCGARILQQLCTAGVSRPLLNAVLVNRTAATHGVQLEEIAAQLECGILGVIVPATEVCLLAEKAGVPLVVFRPDHVASQILGEFVERLLARDALKGSRPVPASTRSVSSLAAV